MGGIVLHDIINNRHANSAVRKGADGLIAVATGAGGHAGTLSPFALVQEIREWFEGPLLLSGAIATGKAVLAAQAMGADMAYIGSPFIATHEARASEDYKDMITQSGASDIVYSNYFTAFTAITSRAPSSSPAWTRTTSPKPIRPKWTSPPPQPRESLERHLGRRPGHRCSEGNHGRRRSRCKTRR